MAAPVLEAPPILTPGLSNASRMVRLLNAAEPAIKRKFLEQIGGARGLRSLEEITTLLEAGRIEEALNMMDEVAGGLSNAIEEAYLAAGLNTADFLRRQTGTMIEFNELNARALAYLQNQRERLIREMTRQQQAATFEALNDGVRRGLRPDQIARSFRDSLGLTVTQQRAVQNFRRLLEEGDSAALTRALRDKRFDRTVNRAIKDGLALTPKQVDRMVDRYRERYINYRANVIARSEALAATNAGDDEMWQQAIDKGIVDPDDVTSTWRTAADERVRDSHSFMNGQVRPFGEPFLSGNGNLLRFPGDPQAPTSDTIQCRCVRARTIGQSQ